MTQSSVDTTGMSRADIGQALREAGKDRDRDADLRLTAQRLTRPR